VTNVNTVLDSKLKVKTIVQNTTTKFFDGSKKLTYSMHIIRGPTLGSLIIQFKKMLLSFKIKNEILLFKNKA